MELYPEDTPTKPLNAQELFKGKKGVLFAVVGAFTPGCSQVGARVLLLLLAITSLWCITNCNWYSEVWLICSTCELPIYFTTIESFEIYFKSRNRFRYLITRYIQVKSGNDSKCSLSVFNTVFYATSLIFLEQLNFDIIIIYCLTCIYCTSTIKVNYILLFFRPTFLSI